MKTNVSGLNVWTADGEGRRPRDTVETKSSKAEGKREREEREKGVRR